MGKWLDAVGAASRRLVWLDDTAYTARVLANGRAPWRDPGAWINWRRQALQLLQPDVAVLDVSACATGWLETDVEPLLRMRERGTSLRLLLDDQRLHAHLGQMLRGLRATTPKPVALTISSPRRWLLELNRLTGCEGVEPIEDEIEDAASDIAGLLRTLSDCGTDVLLLREDEAPTVRVVTWLSCYRSVVNVASHYRWDVGVYLPGGMPSDLKGFSFAVTAAGQGARLFGAVVEPGFWLDDPPPAVPIAGAFLYATIPAEAQPRAVLKRLRNLR